MTISNNYSPDVSTGNGVTTVFTGSWSPLVSTYMRVYLRTIATGADVLQVLDTDYSLSFTDAGYTVTFLITPPPSTKRVIRAREVAIDQTTEYTTAQGFQGATHENSFDKVTAIEQDLSDAVGRSLSFALGSTSSAILPEPAANKILGWNAGGTDLENKALVDLDAAVIGVNVQAWDATLDSISALSGLTDNRLVRTDGTTGLYQQSGITVTDTDNVTIPGGLLMAAATGGNQGAGTVNATGIFVNGVAVSGTGIKTLAVQRFTGNGTYTPTTGMVFCIVEMCAGGGGGGGVSTSRGTAGSGNAGGYLRALLTAAQVGASQAVTIGAGGTAGSTAGTAGGDGGTTSLGSLLSCTGGGHGSQAANVGSTVANAAGGVPTITTGTEISKLTPAPTGNNLNAAAGSMVIAPGGSGPLGQANGQVALGGGASAGAVGTGFGSGGGGAFNGDNSTAGAGAVGQPGLIIITEFSTT